MTQDRVLVRILGEQREQCGHGLRIAHLADGDRGQMADPRAGIGELILLLVALLACCGGLSKKVEEPKRGEDSFVYGFVDMKDAPSFLPQVEKRIAQPLDRSSDRATVP